MNHARCSVLFLCEYGSVNGGENSLLAMLDELRRRDVVVRVMAPLEGHLATRLSDLAVEIIPSPLATATPLSLAEKRRSLSALFTSLTPTLVHSNSLAMGRVAGVVAAELGIPCVAHLRDIARLSNAAVCDLNAHNALIAVSNAVRDAHVAQGLNASKTRVIYNGIDPHLFSSHLTIQPATRSLHRELGLADSAILVATIGQISLRKGVASIPAIHAAVCSQLQASHPPLHWLVVGRRWSDKDESRHIECELVSQCDKHSTGGVHFLGERSDVAAILSDLTLYVHTAWMEPFGRVLLEAAASGVSVVARDVGGTRELFGGSDAVTFAETDTDIASGMIALLSNSARRDAQRAAARDRVQHLFTIDRAVTAICQLYGELLY